MDDSIFRANQKSRSFLDPGMCIHCYVCVHVYIEFYNRLVNNEIGLPDIIEVIIVSLLSNLSKIIKGSKKQKTTYIGYSKKTVQYPVFCYS